MLTSFLASSANRLSRWLSNVVCLKLRRRGHSSDFFRGSIGPSLPRVAVIGDLPLERASGIKPATVRFGKTIANQLGKQDMPDGDHLEIHRCRSTNSKGFRRCVLEHSPGHGLSIRAHI